MAVQCIKKSLQAGEARKAFLVTPSLQSNQLLNHGMVWVERAP